jgi:hypothetical protein
MELGRTLLLVGQQLQRLWPPLGTLLLWLVELGMEQQPGQQLEPLGIVLVAMQLLVQRLVQPLEEQLEQPFEAQLELQLVQLLEGRLLHKQHLRWH